MAQAATNQLLGEPARSFLAGGPGRHLIGGEWVPSADGASFETLDPATGEAITEVAQGGAAEADSAVAAAREAFEGKWGETAPHKRTNAIWALADSIKANAAELAELESLDNGKPVAYARGDIAASVNHLRYYAGWPTKIEGETIPVGAANTLCYTRREPVGVCAQIIPWNFPLLMAIWKLAPVLATGCTTVLKPAEQTPLTALRLGELVAEAGIPPGVINIVTGDGTTGNALVEHPGVDKVAFTGSTAVGREIGARCGRDLKRVTLELGGKSPNIILPDADLEAAIGGSYQGLYFNSGQACNAGSRLFVHASQYDEVVSGLIERAGSAKVGPGLEEGTELGPVVSAE
jgi:acyl-CoA reductase-like NAD-dependent aldehyde dehydrogenase